jgi:hypothetical protein
MLLIRQTQDYEIVSYPSMDTVSRFKFREFSHREPVLLCPEYVVEMTSNTLIVFSTTGQKVQERTFSCELLMSFALTAGGIVVLQQGKRFILTVETYEYTTLKSMNSVRIPETSFSLQDSSISKDGARLAIGTKNGIAIYDTQSGELVHTATRIGRKFCLSYTGDRLFTKIESTIVCTDLETKQTQRIHDVSMIKAVSDDGQFAITSFGFVENGMSIIRFSLVDVRTMTRIRSVVDSIAPATLAFVFGPPIENERLPWLIVAGSSEFYSIDLNTGRRVDHKGLEVMRPNSLEILSRIQSANTWSTILI